MVKINSDSDDDNNSDCDISHGRLQRSRILVSSDDESPDINVETASEINVEDTDNNDVTSKISNPRSKTPIKYIPSITADKNECNNKNLDKNMWPKYRNFKLKLISASDIDSESEDENNALHSSEQLKESETTRLSLASGSDNNDKIKEKHSSGSESSGGTSENDHKVAKKKKKTKSISTSDKKLQIRSETQRMEREANVTLPYHRPKQRTLREFLSRKKNHLKAENLRLTSTHMIHAWEEIDKSIKETTEFFKSESEDETSISGNELKSSGDNLVVRCGPNDDGNKISPDEITCSNLNDKTIVGKEKFLLNTELPDDTAVNVTSLNTDDLCKEINKGNIDEEVGLVSVDENIEKDILCVHSKEIYDSVEEESMKPLIENQVNLCSDKSTDKTNNVDIVEEEPVAPLAETSNNISSNHEKTEMWLEDIAAFERRENLRNKLLLSPSVLNKVPTLSNDPFVDLDDCNSEPSKLQPGAKELMNRLLKAKKSSGRHATFFKTTITDVDDKTGQIQNVRTEIIPLTPTLTTITDSINPGAKIQKFRESLRNKIEAKWEEDFKKRCHEIPVKDDYEEMVDSIDDEAYEGECDDSSAGESEPEEEDVVLKEKPRRFCEFGNSEAEESDPESSSSEQIDEVDDDYQKENEIEDEEAGNNGATRDAEELDCSVIPAFQPGGGLLLGGSTLTQQTQPLPLQVYSPTSSPAVVSSRIPLSPLISSQTNEMDDESRQTDHYRESPSNVQSVKKNLFGAVESSQADMDDPFLFVSGAFPDTAPAVASEEQIKPSPTQSKLKRIVLLEDSDDDNGEHVLGKRINNEFDIVDVPEDTHIASKGLSIQKKTAKLVFSDDSDCSEDEGKKQEDDGKRSDLSDDEIEKKEDDIEYDSEENEVVKVRPGDFFDQEAELSESEWSGDEDERGLDMLEAEAGDADVLDEDQVASQLGKIHMRRMLDEDARDVRLLQELLFEDGDLHSDGKGRDRKFRWKNLAAGFDLNGEHKNEDCSDGEGDSADADGVLAKLRLAKTQFLMQLQQDGKLEQLEEENGEEGNSVIRLGKQLLQRLRTKTNATSSDLASKAVYARGSFLSKDEMFLKRVSRVTTSATEGPLGPSKSSNFVFAVQEKEVEAEVVVPKEGMKRKAISCKETVKRAKLVFGDRPSLLDQLH